MTERVQTKTHFVIPNGVCGERNLLFVGILRKQILAPLGMTNNYLFPQIVKPHPPELPEFFKPDSQAAE